MRGDTSAGVWHIPWGTSLGDGLTLAFAWLMSGRRVSSDTACVEIETVSNFNDIRAFKRQRMNKVRMMGAWSHLTVQRFKHT